MFELNLESLNSSDNLYLFSPKLPAEKISKLRGYLEKLSLKGHVFILSSGSTSGGELKGYALSKSALAANAGSVNRHLGLGADDHWQLSLPHWHIGGLSVFARAALAGSKVFRTDAGWNAKAWVKDLEGAAVTSIVPLQAYDLVKEALRAPKSLRYVIVGGDYLSGELRSRLVQLGWPALRTFGMTEVCSQLATEKRPSEKPALELLDIHEAKTGEGGTLYVKGPSLFTGIFMLDEIFSYQPAAELLADGYFKTSDLARLEGSQLTHLGRSDQAFKAKGRLYFFNELRESLATYSLKNDIFGKVEFLLKDDLRDGKRVELIVLRELSAQKESLMRDLQKLFSPLSLDGPRFVDSINRTELGKLKRS